jgi:hypothetical protein
MPEPRGTRNLYKGKGNHGIRSNKKFLYPFVGLNRHKTIKEIRACLAVRF